MTDADILTHPRMRSASRLLMRTGPFSLVEVIVVVLVLVLALSLVLPRFGRMPRRVVVQTTLSAIRVSFANASLRARSSGQPVWLVLDAETHVLCAESSRPGPDATGDEPSDVAAGSDESPAQKHSKASEGGHVLSSEVEWHLPPDATSHDGATRLFLFEPNGEASGTALEFSVVDSRFRLDVDRLTGRPLLADLSEE